MPKRRNPADEVKAHADGTAEEPVAMLHSAAETSDEILTHPVRHFAPSTVNTISDALTAFRGTGFQSRNLGRCYDILMRVLRDPSRPTVFLGVAGAMVPGGLRQVIRDLVAEHVVDVLVSTGANLYHDLHEALGFRHYLAQKTTPDPELRRHRIDRMFDVYASDEEFVESDLYVAKMCERLEPGAYSTREILSFLGRTLHDPNSILATGAAEDVPIFCPSIADSSIGIALAAHRLKRERAGLPTVMVDTIRDNLEILEIRRKCVKSAAIFVGGGVPKNYIQQIAPMGEILGIDVSPHDYGIQLTTDDPKWGGLSGCTFEESQSWGKYKTSADFVTAYLDATIGLPLLAAAVFERRNEWGPRAPLRHEFESQLL